MVAPPGGAYLLRAIAVRINTPPVRRVSAPAAIPGSISGVWWNAACAAPAAAPRTAPAHINASSRDMQFYPSPCAPGTHSQIRPSRAESTREQAATQAWIPPGRPGRLFRNATGNTILRVISTLRGANARWSDGDESTDSSHQPGLHPKKTREANETGEFSRQRPPRGYVRLASYYQPLVSWRKWVSQEGITVGCIRRTERSRGKKGELVKGVTSWASPQRCFPKSLPWAEGSLGPDLGSLENGAFA